MLNKKLKTILKSNSNNKSKSKMSTQKPTTYTENVSEPWFSLINLGLKTVEGRKNKGRFHDMQLGDII
jgi:hypothetical protein